jgi:hypothetical protein
MSRPVRSRRAGSPWRPATAGHRPRRKATSKSFAQACRLRRGSARDKGCAILRPRGRRSSCEVPLSPPFPFDGPFPPLRPPYGTGKTLVDPKKLTRPNPAAMILRHAKPRRCAGADDGELFLERRRSEALVFRRRPGQERQLRRLRGVRPARGEGRGGGLRPFHRDREAALRRAAETARLAVATAAARWPSAPRHQPRLYTDADPMAGAAFAVKLDTLREIDAFARALDPAWCRSPPRSPPRCRRSRSCAPRACACATSAPWCAQRLGHRRGERPARIGSAAAAGASG